ncbi:MAG: hypothetical protein PHW02_04935 [bacterium]|nr:hypothetical protein [bacterium]
MKEKRIILIDGDKPYLVSLKFILEKNGYGVAAINLDKLREESQEERIIVIDAQVTDIDILKGEEKNLLKKTDRILLLTEYEREEDRVIFSGVMKLIILKKPFLEKDLLKMLLKMDIVDIILEKKMKELEERMSQLSESMNKLDESLENMNEERLSNFENRIQRRIKAVMAKINIEDDENKNI